MRATSPARCRRSTSETPGCVQALRELARRPSPRPGERLAALLTSVRETIDAAVVAFWEAVPGGDGASWKPHVARSPADDGVEAVLPPLMHASLGDETPLVLADLSQVGSLPASDPQPAAPGALVEVPVHDGGRLVGWLAVTTTQPRPWTDAEVDFLMGCALLVALAAKDGPGSPAPEPVASARTVDALTGLPDRPQAVADLAERIAGVASGGPPVVLALGIDRLQDINDGLGFAAGDAVIVQVARALAEAAGPTASVARLGGDEFLVVVQALDGRQVDALVETLLERIAETGGTGIDQVSVDASVGIARYAFDDIDAATLMQQADQAMREAKRRGGGQAFIVQSEAGGGEPGAEGARRRNRGGAGTATSSRSSINRRSRWRPAKSSGWRRWCAGRIRRVACCCRRRSSVRPSSGG